VCYAMILPLTGFPIGTQQSFKTWRRPIRESSQLIHNVLLSAVSQNSIWIESSFLSYLILKSHLRCHPPRSPNSTNLWRVSVHTTVLFLYQLIDWRVPSWYESRLRLQVAGFAVPTTVICMIDSPRILIIVRTWSCQSGKSIESSETLISP
jgi:hypothetical protein